MPIALSARKLRISRSNALGQLKDIWEVTASDQWTETINFPNQTLSAGYRTSYSYDTLNNLTTVNQGVQTRSFTYSSLSRLLTANNPESGTITYSYDSNSNLTSKVDARSITASYSYDVLNRVTQRSYAGGSITTPTVTYTYGTTAPAIGKLTKVASSVSTTEYTEFDILGRVKAHKQTTDGTAYTTGYIYNLSGALIEETYPSGRVVKNTLDADGDLQQVQSRKVNDTFRNYANGFAYNAAGAATAIRLGNGKWESTQFNSRLQPTQIGLGTSATNQGLLKLDYTYNTPNVADNNGNVKSQTITVPNAVVNGTTYNGFTATQNYTYDSLNRLKSATENITGQTPPSWKQTFTFDRYGNRNFDEANTTTLPKDCLEFGNPVVCEAVRPIVNPSVNTANNRLNGYVFDNAGNTTQDAQLRKFTYDGENKQTKVETVNSSGTVTGTLGEYFYDGDGKRIKKIVPSTGETTIFVYDASGKSIAEYSTLVAPVSEAKVSYLTNDHLGSPRITTDANGAVISRRDFMPYGEEIQRANYGSDSVRQKFTGYERDTETDLDFAQARYFASGLGRFSSPDPLLLSAKLDSPQTWNRYPYVLNNPLTLVDRDGLYPSPAYNCSESNKACLNDEQRRILNDSAKNFGKKTGEEVYAGLGEKEQNAFVNITDKLGSLKTDTGATLLSLVKNVTEFGRDRIVSTVSSDLDAYLKNSDQFKAVPAGDHKPFDAVSYKDTGPTFGNVQFSLNKQRTGADIDMDIGNAVSGDVAGPVVHGVEYVYNKSIGKLFDRKTNQNTIRRILLADPSVQTITPSPNAKYNRRQK